MGGKGGGSQTVTQTTLPEYAKPYVERLFTRGESESQRAYEPYGSQRIAGPDASTLQGRLDIEGLGSGINGLPQAQGATGTAMAGAEGIAGMADPFSQFQFGPSGTYTAQNVSQYMSPYMQNVVDVEKSQAQLDFERAQSGRDAAAVQAGAFGGTRGAVVDALAQEDLARRQAEIQARGQQAAFETGSGLFEADRMARMSQEQQQASEQGRVQQGALDLGQLGLAGFQLSGDLAGQLAGLGEAERAAAIEQAGLLQQVGADRTEEEQALLSQDYQDFMRQQQYNQEQLEWYSDLLRGNIRNTDIASQDYANANPYQQLLGAGLGALGLSQSGI